MSKKLYLDRNLDYKKNLDIFLSEESTELEKKKAYDGIFMDFKTYIFNKIRTMRTFLPISVVDEWSTEVTLSALTAIRNKGLNKRESWPEKMGGYLGLFCLEINNIKKFSIEKIEIPTENVMEPTEYYKNEKEGLIMIDNKVLDDETGAWLIKEAIKMTVMNDGFSMVDIDRTIKLLDKYNGKIGRFRKKYTNIKDALEKNIKSILEGNIKVEREEQ